MTRFQIMSAMGFAAVFFGLWQENVSAGCFIWFLLLGGYPAYLRYLNLE